MDVPLVTMRTTRIERRRCRKGQPPGSVLNKMGNRLFAEMNAAPKETVGIARNLASRSS
jgi:hypothetical protein